MFGHRGEDGEQAGGVMKHVLDEAFAFFAAAQAAGRARMLLSASFVEVYNEGVTDLLCPEASTAAPQPALPVREVDGAFRVAGLTQVSCSSRHAVLRTLAAGSANKRMGESYVHGKSSRSHTIFRMTLATALNDTGEARISELNIVDLAGAEVLMAGGGDTHHSESKAINLSLFNLKAVIDALADKAPFVPYRNSTLTKLLSNSLGGNARTVLLCTASLSSEHAGFTTRTLRFGSVAKRVVNKTVNNVSRSGGGAAGKLRDADRVQTATLDLRGRRAGKPASGAAFTMGAEADAECWQQFEVQYVPTPAGELCVHHNGAWGQRVAVLLHGYGSGCGASNLATEARALAERGFHVVGIDLPGFSGSRAVPRCSGRTEKMWGEGGPLVCVESVLAAFGVTPKKRAVVFGFDFGGSLALGLASRPAKARLVRAACVYHANWTDSVVALNKVSVPVAVMWMTSDQNHPMAVGNKIVRALPKGTLTKLRAGPFRAGLAYDDSVLQQVVVGLLKVAGDPGPATRPPKSDVAGTAQAQPVTDAGEPVREEEAILQALLQGAPGATAAPGGASASGAGVALPTAPPALCGLLSATDDEDLADLVFGAGAERAMGLGRAVPPAPTTTAQASSPALSAEALAPPADCSSGQALTRWAVGAFRGLVEGGQVKELYQHLLTSTPLRPAAVRLLGALPSLSPGEVSTQDLVDWGVWPCSVQGPPSGALEALPRYPRGRRVLVRTEVFARLEAGGDRFLAGMPPGQGKVTVTHRARVQGPDPASPHRMLVAVDTAGGGTDLRSVPSSAVFELNEPTRFRKTVRGAVLFEDGVEAKYSDLLTRGKVMEAALAVAHLADTICPHLADASPGDAGALQAQLEAVTAITGVIDCRHIPNQGAEVGRSSRPEVGRLVHYGQGHCHTQASVCCAMLLPFGALLGLEVKFRGGTVHGGGGEGAGWMREGDDHTWCEVTLLPSMQSFVVDLSFGDIAIPAEEVYSLAGRRQVLWRSKCDCTAPRAGAPATVHAAQVQEEREGEHKGE